MDASAPRDPDWTRQRLRAGDTEAILERARSEPDYLHARDDLGDTPLLAAVAADAPELVEQLLALGADPNVPVDDGYPALILAVQSDHPRSPAVVSALLAAGADVHASGLNDWTPLHVAANGGWLDKARLLLEAGADVDRRTRIDGCVTPLIEAARAGNPDLVELLLAHGADASVRDSVFGWTALEAATSARSGADPEVIETLASLAAEQGDPGLRALAAAYRESADRLATEGDHERVIQILAAHAQPTDP